MGGSTRTIDVSVIASAPASRPRARNPLVELVVERQTEALARVGHVEGDPLEVEVGPTGPEGPAGPIGQVGAAVVDDQREAHHADVGGLGHEGDAGPSRAPRRAGRCRSNRRRSRFAELIPATASRSSGRMSPDRHSTASDGHSVEGALDVAVVVDAVVHRAAIVPAHDIAGPPPVAVYVVGRGRLVVQELQDGKALGLGQPLRWRPSPRRAGSGRARYGRYRDEPGRWGGSWTTASRSEAGRVSAVPLISRTSTGLLPTNFARRSPISSFIPSDRRS